VFLSFQEHLRKVIWTSTEEEQMRKLWWCSAPSEERYLPSTDEPTADLAKAKRLMVCSLNMSLDSLFPCLCKEHGCSRSIFPLHSTPVASADLVTILEESMRDWCSEKGTNKASFLHASWESNG
jgi:hypothetical protein